MLHELGRVKVRNALRPQGPELGIPALKTFLEELLPGLRARMPMKCQAVADQLCSAVPPKDFRDDIGRICVLLEQYNFVPALTLAEQILERINREK